MALLPHHRRHRQQLAKLLGLGLLIWLVLRLFLTASDESIDNIANPEQQQEAKVDYGHHHGGQVEQDPPKVTALFKVAAHEAAGGGEGKVVEKENLRASSDSGVEAKNKHKAAAEDDNVIAAPRNLEGPGEMGRPVSVENPDPETKRLLDEGWQNNAFNQYVSDMISVHRTLPDFR